MKKVGNHNSISKNLIFSFAVLLALTLNSFSQTKYFPIPGAKEISGSKINGKLDYLNISKFCINQG